MATIAEWVKVDAENVARQLERACADLERSDGRLLLDFSAVRRIDPAALAALDELSVRADEQGVHIVLRGVNAEMYKVLKLVRLASDLSFID